MIWFTPRVVVEDWESLIKAENFRKFSLIDTFFCQQMVSISTAYYTPYFIMFKQNSDGPAFDQKWKFWNGHSCLWSVSLPRKYSNCYYPKFASLVMKFPLAKSTMMPNIRCLGIFAKFQRHRVTRGLKIMSKSQMLIVGKAKQ